MIVHVIWADFEIRNQSNELTIQSKALSSSTTTSGYETVHLHCSTNDDDYFVTDFDRRDRFLRIITISENELMILVRSFSSNYLIFWYVNDFTNNSEALKYISCVSGPKTEAQRITVHGYFLPNKIYIFCIANKWNLLIYPLNCVAYQRVVKEEVRPNGTNTGNQCQMPVVPKNVKTQIIAGMIVIYLACVCIGAALLNAIHRKIGEIRRRDDMCEVNNNVNYGVLH